MKKQWLQLIGLVQIRVIMGDRDHQRGYEAKGGRTCMQYQFMNFGESVEAMKLKFRYGY